MFAAPVKRLSPDEGLTQSHVNELLVDKQGYLWIATQGGLNKYDGIINQAVEGPDGILKDMAIDLLYQDMSGTIWIFSLAQGLLSFSVDTSQYRQYLFQPQSLEQSYSQAVYAMLDVGDDTHLWLGRGTNVAILNRHTGEINTVLEIPNADFKASAVRKLLQFERFLFAATTEGLYVYDVKSGQSRLVEHTAETPTSLNQNNTKELALIDNETLLLGTVQGLYQVDISNLAQMMETPDVPFKNIELISDLNIWTINQKSDYLHLATNQGLYQFYLKENHLVKNNLVNEQFTLSDPSFVNMIEDQHGSMWLGTKNDGAFFIPENRSLFFNYHNENLRGPGLSHHNVWSIAEQGEYVWLGTNNGLTKLNLSTYESEVYLQNYFADEFNSEFNIQQFYLVEDHIYLSSVEGMMAFNTQTYQLSALETVTEQHQDYLKDYSYGGYMLNNEQLYLIHIELGPYIYNIRTRGITPLGGDFTDLDMELAQRFLAPLPDKPNQVLFFQGGKLFRVDSEQQTLEVIYQLDRMVHNNSIWLSSHLVDKNNILWLSFTTFGLIGLDADTFQIVHPFEDDKKDIGSLLYGMISDDEGMIWLSTHQGILRFDPDNGHFQRFTVDEGLDTNEFNDSASLKLSDGRIAYGSVKGLTVFSPKQNRPHRDILKQVNITSVKLMSPRMNLSSMSKVSEIELDHDVVGLEIAYSAMTFKLQDRVEYQYQLGEQKRVSTKNNNVVFPKFNPGVYEFKIRARDPLTGNYTPYTSLKIIIKHPPFRSPIFMTLYGLLCLVALFTWFYRRNKIQLQLVQAHKESQESEARLKLALEGSQSGVWDWNIHSAMIYQPRLINELGYESEQLSLEEYLNKIHPDDRAKFRIEWLEFLSTSKGFFECVYRVKDHLGHWRWYKDFGKVMAWQNDMPSQVAGTYTNMTRELAFEESARLFSAAFEHTRDWVLILDKRYRVRAVNKVLSDAFSFTLESQTSRSLTLGLSKETRLNYLRIMAKLNLGEHFQSDEVVITADGVSHPVIIKVSTMGNKDDCIDNYIVVITDITEQKEAEKELRVLANYDPLTKLPNRSLLVDRIAHATELGKRHHSRVALLFIDLDHFKQVNDTLGHDYGDKLLITVANRLKNILREQDTVARLGGDEFVILIEDIDEIDELIPVCRKICHEVGLPVQLGNHLMNVTPSVGVAIYPDDSKDPMGLLKSSDIAMYHAKKQGGSTYQFFHQEMNQKIQRKLQLEIELKEGVQHDEFINYYQPIICATEHKLKGFEVLLRWQQLTGVVSPGEFIPVAESMGIITTLTLATLERALKDLAHWLTVQPDCYISINLSARDFDFEGIAEQLTLRIEQAGIKAQHVVFEITESALMQDTEKALEVMLKLKELGCRIYMDDFGTGYSSLAYLKRFPIDVLKIDQSFVHDIGQDVSDEAIIHSTLALAHSLGKACVAEGVETQVQAEFLQMFGCDYLQGYLLSKPQPAENIESLLNTDWRTYF
ncbi:hypothetical protein PULV_a2176 [Pseudoalteromonas ulvae UL12]|uniref:Diguanylate phosphodiesterase n=1 Tax=Pseudoalteromonas ulvae TaxID=107327 RepID=A0A244CQH1_PSEDV|nr:hypothetical protein [Pseudoalteromonas ulvae UL12]OUL57867.1 hypothetical protein B1199_12500 [Pseudoalteromonas ulvae]